MYATVPGCVLDAVNDVICLYIKVLLAGCANTCDAADVFSSTFVEEDLSTESLACSEVGTTFHGG